MKLKIKYNSELGMEDFVAEPISSEVESPMSIYLVCKDGKKRNAEATLKETALAMFFATRGLFNIFDSDIENIEIDGLKGLNPVVIKDENKKGTAVFKSRYKVCNWRVSLGSIDEFYYITHNTEDKLGGTIKYRENFANMLRVSPDLSKYMSESDVIPNVDTETFRQRILILATALKSSKTGLGLRITEAGSLCYTYKSKLIYTMTDADKYITDDLTYTIFLFLQLMLTSVIKYDRFDMIYVDAQDLSMTTLNMFKMIAQILKNDMSNLDQSVNLIFYNLSKTQMEKLKSGDVYSQVIELPNSRDNREESNLKGKK